MKLKILLLSILFLLFSISLFAQDSSSISPFEIETAFVYNFLKFVSWPDKKEEFLFCVVGKTPLLPYLLDLNGQEINGKSLKVLHISPDSEQLDNCKAIFVGRLKKVNKTKLFSKIDHKPILTISDRPGFVEKGGIIEIFLKQGRFRFKINLSVARKVNLFISSQLLRLSEEVIQ